MKEDHQRNMVEDQRIKMCKTVSTPFICLAWRVHVYVQPDRSVQ